MTKTKLFEAAMAVCETHNITGDALTELTTLLKPKVGGSKADVNDYTVFDADQNVSYIFCTFHKMWEPVSAETEDGDIINLFGSAKTPNGFARECKVGVSQWKKLNKEYKEQKEAIISDVLNEVISGEEGKEALKALDESKNYTAVHPDGIGSDDRPEV